MTSIEKLEELQEKLFTILKAKKKPAGMVQFHKGGQVYRENEWPVKKINRLQDDINNILKKERKKEKRERDQKVIEKGESLLEMIFRKQPFLIQLNAVRNDLINLLANEDKIKNMKPLKIKLINRLKIAQAFEEKRIGVKRLKKAIKEAKDKKVKTNLKTKLELAKRKSKDLKNTVDDLKKTIKTPEKDRELMRQVRIHQRTFAFPRGTKVRVQAGKYKGAIGVIEAVTGSGIRILVTEGLKESKTITVSHDQLDRNENSLVAIGQIKSKKCDHTECVDVMGELVCRKCKKPMEQDEFVAGGLGGPEEGDEEGEYDEFAEEREEQETEMDSMKHGFKESYRVVDQREEKETKANNEELLVNEFLNIILEPEEFQNKVKIKPPKSFFDQIKKMKNSLKQEGVDAENKEISDAITVARLLFYLNEILPTEVNVVLLQFAGQGEIFNNPVFLANVAKMFGLLKPIVQVINGTPVVVLSIDSLLVNFVERFKESGLKLKNKPTYKLPAEGIRGYKRRMDIKNNVKFMQPKTTKLVKPGETRAAKLGREDPTKKIKTKVRIGVPLQKKEFKKLVEEIKLLTPQKGRFINPSGSTLEFEQMTLDPGMEVLENKAVEIQKDLFEIGKGMMDIKINPRQMEQWEKKQKKFKVKMEKIRKEIEKAKKEHQKKMVKVIESLKKNKPKAIKKKKPIKKKMVKKTVFMR